jgi:glucokinase
MTGSFRLVADVGGTNARFALAGADGVAVYALTVPVADFPRFDEALAAYLANIDTPDRERIGSAAFAAAGPVDGETIKLTNAPWQLDRRDISDRLGGLPVGLFNDLEAVAFALPFLEERDVLPIGPVPRPAAGSGGRMIAVNAGTGFGAAAAIAGGDGWTACPSEAGHMTLAAADEQEAALFARIAPGRTPTLEDVLSGSGVETLYAALSGAEPLSAGELFACGTRDAAAGRTVDIFGRSLGRATGDLVLATAAWGGAFLLGGVVSGWHRHCDHAGFRKAFEDKGKMRTRMGGLFTGVVCRANVALLGLAKAPVNGSV